jgi:alkylated DNA repair dioxygenase AlkB
MKLLSNKIFDDTDTIKGLKYIPNYIDQDQENQLISIIDTLLWSDALARRVQHYGFSYDYASRKLSSNYLGALPNFLDKLARKLYDEGDFPQIPDQVIINEYLGAQGIAAHIDCPRSFGPVICSISLLSSCMMNFILKEKTALYLEPRSLLILEGDARFIYKHEIEPRKYDNFLGSKIARKRRVSVTFRKVISDQL